MRELHVAGGTITVSEEDYARLTSPDGWASLTLDELAVLGIHPAMADPGLPPIHTEWRPDSKE